MRVALFLWDYNPGKGIFSDTAGYERPAVSLLKEGRFTEALEFQEFFAGVFGGTPSREPRPMFIRTPGFPVFIAAVYGLGGNRIALIMVQILISGVGIWFTFLLGKALFSEVAGVWAALAVAIDPLTTWCAQVISPDTLFTTLFIGAMLFAIALLRKPDCRLGAGFGTVLALTTLVKPVTYYLAVPACILFWLAGLPKKTLASVLAPLMLLVGGWQLRNLATVGSAQFSGIEGVNLLIYRAASIISKQEHIPMGSAKKQLVRSLPAPSSLSAAELNRVYTRAAMRIIAAHPMIYLRDVARGIEVIALTPGRLRFSPVPFAWHVVFTILLYTFLACGLRTLWRTENPVLHGFVALIVAYMVLAAAGADSLDRYRLPIMPFLAVYAGAGVSWVYERVTRRSGHVVMPGARSLETGPPGALT
jgi:hypothetical protein